MRRDGKELEENCRGDTGRRRKTQKRRIKKGGQWGGMLVGIRKELITGEEIGMGNEDEKEGLIIEEKGRRSTITEE